LRGALIIYGNPTLYQGLYDAEHVLMLSDWYHTPALDLIPYYLSPASGGNEPIPDSGLINNAGDYDCTNAPPGSNCNANRSNSQRYATFNVSPGKKYRLRIVNSAAFSMFKFSIDEHTLTVIEVDGVDVQPYNVTMLSLNVAQRYSVIVLIKMIIILKIIGFVRIYKQHVFQLQLLCLIIVHGVSYKPTAMVHYQRQKVMIWMIVLN